MELNEKQIENGFDRIREQQCEIEKLECEIIEFENKGKDNEKLNQRIRDGNNIIYETTNKIKRNELQCQDLETRFNEIAEKELPNIKNHINNWMDISNLSKNQQIDLIKSYSK